MKPKNTRVILKQYFLAMHRHYQDLLEDFGEEAIHDFRQEVKKLRAFLRLQNTGRGEESSLQIGKKLRSFYRVAGDLRTLQLQQKRVLQHCKKANCRPPVHYLAALHEDEEAAKKRLRSQALSFSMKQYRQHLFKAALEAGDTAMPEQFAVQKKLALQRHLSVAVLQDDDLHTVRKILKDLLSIWPWIPSFIKTIFPVGFATRKGCKALTDRLGDFQDICTALSLLTPGIISASPDKEEKSVLAAMIEQWEDNKQVARMEINLLLSNLLQSMQCNATSCDDQPRLVFHYNKLRTS